MTQSSFRFRVWDKEIKQMHYSQFFITPDGTLYRDKDPHGVDMSGGQKIFKVDPKRFVVYFATGRFDVEGVMIYPKDIIEAQETCIHQHWPKFERVIEETRVVRFLVRTSKVDGIQLVGVVGEYAPQSAVRSYYRQKYDQLEANGDWQCHDTYNRDYSEYRNFRLLSNCLENPELLKEE